ncbi:PAS domain S-box protein, partial [bacterium]|nr:PAS domain S-box protein [bacterium]
VYEFTHPDDILENKAVTAPVLHGEKDFCRMEKRYIRKDGQVVWGIMSTSAVRDENGKPLYFVTHVQDITERKQMEEALGESLQRLAIVSDTAGQLLVSEYPQQVVQVLCERVMAHLDCHAFFNYLVDEERNCLRLNACAGIPEETAREIHFLDFGVAVCGCAARDATRIVAENIPSTPDIRTDLVRSFGITAYACHPLFAEGDVIGTLSFGTRSRLAFSEDDLSLMKTVADLVATAMERMRLLRSAQRRRTELEALVSERTAELRRRAELLELAHDAIVVKDIDGRVTLWNRGAEEMYGWTLDEARGRAIHDLLQTGYTVSHDDPTNTLLETGAWEGELKHTTKDGRTMTVLSRQALQKDETGKPIAIMEINLDITAAKEAEDQLRQAHKMEAIGTLAGGIAHDFNNILAAILGFTEMAIEDVQDRP